MASDGDGIVYDKLIGSGSYGEVWSARCNGNRVAAKRIHSIYFETDRFDQQARDFFIEQFRKESEVLRKLEHPNIVRMLTVLFPTSKNRSPVIVTELLHCDLEAFIRNSKSIPKIGQKEGLSLALGVAEGLQYLHGLKPAPVVHRDLATKNILLTKEMQPKIADLGVAKIFASGKDMQATPSPGTPLYAAPETLSTPMGQQATMMYGVKVDIFSFGAVVLAIIVGHEPAVWPLSHLNEDGSKISESVRRKNDIEEMGHNKMRSVVLRCLKDRSCDRPDAASIVRELKDTRDTLDTSSRNSIKVQAGTSGSSAGLKRLPIAPFKVKFDRVPQRPHYDFKFKTLFLGNAAVGKSCLFQKLNNPGFNIKMTTATIGIDIDRAHFQYDTKFVQMMITDTAGQEEYFSIQRMYFRGVHGIFLVFDLTRETSFLGLHRWINHIEIHGSDAKILLVGNKVDKTEKRQVPEPIARNFAIRNGFPYVETTLDDDYDPGLPSLMNMYKKITRMLIQAVDIGEIHLQVPESQITVKQQPPKQKSKCPC